MPTLRDQLVKIAKRGRKRHLGLTFVTQSPNDLPDEVLGLVNNWIIYKIDDPIIRRLRSLVPNADDSLWHLVRGLGAAPPCRNVARGRTTKRVRERLEFH